LRQTEPDRSIQIDIQPKMRISADPVLLRSIMDNLIGNAWKFTARTPNARIEVSLVTRDGIPVCRVRDNGAGFNMTHATNLFKPFHRLHRAEEFPGTGVGLTTVERIVRRHGGKVWVEAREGHGADFYFTLEPAPSPGPGGPQPEESRDNGR
jgi:light-regulated signal transduction histidine kinase (bacteriophytochrome)